MMPATAIQASTNLLAQLVNPAARVLALACVAWLGLAAFRVKSTSVHLFTWTAVLYAAVAMPLLGWMLPPLSVPTPAFPQFGTPQSVSIARNRAVKEMSPAKIISPATSSSLPGHTPAEH